MQCDVRKLVLSDNGTKENKTAKQRQPIVQDVSMRHGTEGEE
jgi:hypothetical protein